MPREFERNFEHDFERFERFRHEHEIHAHPHPTHHQPDFSWGNDDGGDDDDNWLADLVVGFFNLFS